MPTRDGVLHVRVVDETGKERKPGAKDKASVDGADLKYDAVNGFVFEIKSTKDIQLDVSYDGFAEIRQWFAAEAPAERPKMTAFWPGTDKKADAPARRRNKYLLECMSLTRVAGGHEDARSPWVFNLTVKLYPCREYVAVIGTDYWDGAFTAGAHPHKAGLDFVGYAQTFGKHVFAHDDVNSSSPFTMLDCQRGVVERWMRARGMGWRRQFVIQTKTAAPPWPTVQSFRDWMAAVEAGVIPAADFLGATDVYTYLSGIGSSRKETVIDFSIFSHAWHAGPILFNTKTDHDATRTTTDLDMRKLQDFDAANSAAWGSMPSALHADAVVRVWGCFATEEFREMVYFLTHRPGSRFRFGSTDLDRPGVVAELSRLLDTPDESYMKAIAKFVSRPAFGGPPGSGSEWIAYSDLKAIPRYLRREIGASQIMYVPRTKSPSSRVRRLYASPELGSREFDWFGYLKYTP